MFFLDSVRGVQPVPTDTSVHHRRRPLLGRDHRLLKQTHPGRSSKVSKKKSDFSSNRTNVYSIYFSDMLLLDM